MRLEGSCHCGAVRFSLDSDEPVPFMHCYCSICRKTAGSGGYAVNLGGSKQSLRVEGSEHVGVYRAMVDSPEEERPKRSEGERSFCRTCGSALWVWDPRWPELVHPHAGAIDTPLPDPPSRVHMMLEFKPQWVDAHVQPQDRTFAGYPDESLAEWHARQGFKGPNSEA
jgi:hypothetical protein